MSEDNKKGKVHPDLASVLREIYESPVYRDMEEIEGVSKEDVDASRAFIHYMAEQMSAVIIMVEENIKTRKDWEAIAGIVPIKKEK